MVFHKRDLILSYGDDEITHDISLKRHPNCPVCAERYGYVAMMKNHYQQMIRRDDTHLMCPVCRTTLEESPVRRWIYPPLSPRMSITTRRADSNLKW